MRHCYLWDAGNTAWGSETVSHALLFSISPFLQNLPGSWSTLARSLYSLSFPRHWWCGDTYRINDSRAGVLVSSLGEKHFSLCFSSPLGVAWAWCRKTEKLVWHRWQARPGRQEERASFMHLLGTLAPKRFGAEGSEVCSTEQTVKGMVALFSETGLVRVWTFSRAFPKGLPAAPAVRGNPMILWTESIWGAESEGMALLTLECGQDMRGTFLKTSHSCLDAVLLFPQQPDMQCQATCPVMLCASGGQDWVGKEVLWSIFLPSWVWRMEPVEYAQAWAPPRLSVGSALPRGCLSGPLLGAPPPRSQADPWHGHHQAPMLLFSSQRGWG